MTNKEAAAILINYFKPPIILNDGKSMAHLLALEAIEKAVDALEAVGKIKEIINISNFVIQEDVLKYKMICEVVEKMDGGKNESSR